MTQNRCLNRGHIMIGFIFIFIGLIMLLDKIGIIESFNFGGLWPVVLIFIGMSVFSKTKKKPAQLIFGLIFLGSGVLLLLRNFELIPYFHISWSMVWPVLLILLGIKIFFSHKQRTPDGSKSESKGKIVEDKSTEDVIDLSVVLGEGNFRFPSKQLKGGRISTVLGSTRVYLSDADMAGESMTLDLHAFMGGIEIYIPKNWKLNVKSTPFMGGIEHKIMPGSRGEGPEKTLIIQGSVIMAGVEIKA